MEQEIETDSMLRFDSRILSDDLMSADEKGSYLLGLARGEWSEELVKKLQNLGYINPVGTTPKLENQMISVERGFKPKDIQLVHLVKV